MRSDDMTNPPENTALSHVVRTLEGGMAPDNVAWITQGIEKEETLMSSSPPTTKYHTGRKFMLRSMFRSLFAPRSQSQARPRPQGFQPQIETLESRLAPTNVYLPFPPVGTGSGVLFAPGSNFNLAIQSHVGSHDFIGIAGNHNLAIQSFMGSGNTIAITGSGDVAIQSNEGSGNTIIQMS
jgi:hypothetical protein